MIAGVSGSLISQDVCLGPVHDGDAVLQRLRGWHHGVRNELGPTAGARTVFDRVASPLFALLGYTVVPSAGRGPDVHATLAAGGRVSAALIVTPWEADLAATWRVAVRGGIGHGLRWCFCVNGPALRVVDARRSYSRRYVEFALSSALDDPSAARLLRALLGADGFGDGAAECALDRAVRLSEQTRAAVRATLQSGVHDALLHLLSAFAKAPGRRRRDVGSTFDESLVIVYRVLFLLFAEARGLVPQWHPTYRDGYTIESLRDSIEREARPRGLWEALQAIARMAHRGCRAGTLSVPPFNGRLFSPSAAPLSEALALDDGAVRLALLSLTTRKGEAGLQRISYRDLGVEHLGGVYERLLDYKPAHVPGSPPSLVRAERRKSTGSFYTPRSLTEYLVRRTLAPLVEHAASTEILSLRVVDPAMGSGAFLVAACRFLAAAFEQALLREGGAAPGDIGDAERANVRRVIAQRCLFGVDVNPMAVQLGRLSLWLATLAAGRPLTFLDHHLRAGNSLVGASVADVLRQPPGRDARPRPGALPLFSDDALDGALAAAIVPRLAIACEPGDTLEQVRGKERALAALGRQDAPLARWKAAADLWCAAWFAADRAIASRRTFGALLDLVLRGAAALPPGTAARLLAGARETARRIACFHWTLEFPEVFYAANGQPIENAGFDAVLGNPPWEMLRGDRGGAGERLEAHAGAAALTGFARHAGVYRVRGAGHANLYQLFLERALSLLRSGGRFGLVLPSGFANDAGSASLRRYVLDRASVDTFTGVENHGGLFPIHRDLRFLLVAGSAGASTAALPCRFGIRSPDVLDAMPDTGAAGCMVVGRSLIERSSQADCAIPELRTGEDAAVFSSVVFRVPAFGSASGWGLRFGRELNATEDRRHFTRGGRGLPVIEGKLLRPFATDAGAAPLRIARAAAAGLLDAERTFLRPRLGYRDVASATNRLTLIAAIVPALTVTTHTVFCLRDERDEDVHFFLCGLFNSYVANYLVRLRVGTHVTTRIVDWLPVPRPARDSGAFGDVARLARRLTAEPGDDGAHARLQGLCARLYGLTAAEFGHVLGTFPLVSRAERDAAFLAFGAG